MSSQYVCDYCQHKFSTMKILRTHQKTARFCLEIQGEKVVFQQCSFCNQEFVDLRSYRQHEAKCEREAKELVVLKHKFTELERKYKNMVRQKRDLEKKVLCLETEKTVSDKFNQQQTNNLEKLQTSLETIAQRAIDKPTNNTNNNISLNLKTLDPEWLKEQSKNLKPEHVIEGPCGIARYSSEYPLRDRAVCSDSSRYTFKYKRPDGKIVLDDKAIQITKSVFDSISEQHEQLTNEAIEEIKTNIENDIDLEHNLDQRLKMEIYRGGFQQTIRGKTDNDFFINFIRYLGEHLPKARDTQS